MTRHGARIPVAVRCTASERPVWTRAVGDLNAALMGACVLSLAWLDDLDAAGQDESAIIGLSLLPDLRSGVQGRTEVDWPATETRWRDAIVALRDGAMSRGATVFVVTIFRQLPPNECALLPHLRRLNLLAARLSQEFGLFVIDLDRVLAHRGAINLGADAHLASPLAQRVAAETIVDALLGAGIENLVDDAVLRQAIQYHQQHREVDQSRLSGPREWMQLERRQVKSRTQVFAIQRNLIDDRSLAGLLRDLRTGRLGTVGLAREVVRRLAERLASRRA